MFTIYRVMFYTTIGMLQVIYIAIHQRFDIVFNCVLFLYYYSKNDTGWMQL